MFVCFFIRKTGATIGPTAATASTSSELTCTNLQPLWNCEIEKISNHTWIIHDSMSLHLRLRWHEQHVCKIKIKPPAAAAQTKTCRAAITFTFWIHANLKLMSADSSVKFNCRRKCVWASSPPSAHSSTRNARHIVFSQNANEFWTTTNLLHQENILFTFDLLLHANLTTNFKLKI